MSIKWMVFLYVLSSGLHASSVELLPDEIQQQMLKSSWHKGCPVALSDLVLVTVDYWGFDDAKHQGELVVHKSLGAEVKSIFDRLYQQRFPIERIERVDDYNGDDAMLMKKNITSAFNCRLVTGQPGIYSQHSYGRAIDINPLINPYVNKDRVLPIEGKIHVNRNQPAKGKITQDSLVYKLFIDNGWDWGGSWPDLQDYQHFEKRANGEKRVPYGTM